MQELAMALEYTVVSSSEVNCCCATDFPSVCRGGCCMHSFHSSLFTQKPHSNPSIRERPQ
ncbi:hypothetical protein BJX61DRAFT_494688 [Aspergillus egyptiacus]|nr:hypothetical protein BJX61DRAFT_494688 [Aspergillus egyptiacus]